MRTSDQGDRRRARAGLPARMGRWDGGGRLVGRTVAASAALVMAVGAVGLTPSGDSAVVVAVPVATPFDFDGDGYGDLAAGVSGEDLGTVTDAGAVQVLYGSATGPTNRDQLWYQGRDGLAGTPEENDRFGEALASGDFDADGYADLAVGVTGEDLDGTNNTGAVQVLYGGPSGLTASRAQLWHQGVPGVPGANEDDDWFGSSLVVGDFDGDAHADLVIGVSGEQIGASDNRGRVVVLTGSAAGLTATEAASFRLGAGGLGSRDDSGWFGSPLAAGDVTGDGRDDLVVGARVRRLCRQYGECPPSFFLLRGGSGGLSTADSQFVDGAGELGLGYVGGGGAPLGDVTLSDFDSDGRADLALVAQENWVALLHGHADGFHPAPLQAPGVPGRDAVWSIPGWAEDDSGEVASGDLTGDGSPDLVVRVDDPVMVFPGSDSGLTGSIIQWPVYGYASLAVLPLTGPDHAWLVSAVDGQGLPFAAGALTALQGTSDGAPGPATVWSQDSPGIQGAAEAQDYFGWVLP